jgi:hypothetical protein
LVGGDDGAVDQGVFEVRLVGQAREDAFEHAALHPAAEPLEDAVPVAELARQVAPGGARPHPPQHRLQEQPVVPGRRARIGRLAGQQWRDLLPNRLADHEPRSLQHRLNPAEAELESQPVSRGNPQCQQPYYVGKDPAMTFGTALPFGLNSRQMWSWLYHAGGREMLAPVWRDQGVHGITAGNTGAQMGGWFRREIKTVQDLQG